jgi:hypothetical protein
MEMKPACMNQCTRIENKNEDGKKEEPNKKQAIINQTKKGKR